LGIYISRDFIQAGIVDLKGSTLRSERIQLSTTETEADFFRKLYLVTDRIVNLEKRDNLWGIGIACIGPLNIHNGIILNPPNFHSIKNLNIGKPLSERYGLPAYLENDMNVSALAEMYFGNGQLVKDFVYVGITTGIGAGIVIDRKLYNGHQGFGGEIGHITVDIDGEACGCGNHGCLEVYANIPSILQWTEQAYQKRGLKKPDMSWLWLVDEALQNNEICIAAINRQCRYLSAALVSLVNLFDPECVIIGGDIGFAAELTIPYLNKALNENKFSPNGFPVPVLPSRFPSGATFVGTAALVLERNLEKEVLSVGAD
jgi:predicted NBD/HSP70 family sugar kinase